MLFTHYSDKPINQVVSVTKQPDINAGWQNSRKPFGFWMSTGLDWYEYGHDKWPDRFQFAYLVDVELGPHIYQIKTSAELRDFGMTFGIHQTPLFKSDYLSNNSPTTGFLLPTLMTDLSSSVEGINWHEVCRRWKGIAIVPYLGDGTLNWACKWYWGWDVPSVCVWDASCIKGLRPTTTEIIKTNETYLKTNWEDRFTKVEQDLLKFGIESQ